MLCEWSAALWVINDPVGQRPQCEAWLFESERKREREIEREMFYEVRQPVNSSGKNKRMVPRSVMLPFHRMTPRPRLLASSFVLIRAVCGSHDEISGAHFTLLCETSGLRDAYAFAFTMLLDNASQEGHC